MTGGDPEDTPWPRRTPFLVPESTLRTHHLIQKSALDPILRSIREKSIYTAVSLAVGSGALGAFLADLPKMNWTSLTVTALSALAVAYFIKQRQNWRNQIDDLKDQSEEEKEKIEARSKVEMSLTPVTGDSGLKPDVEFD